MSLLPLEALQTLRVGLDGGVARVTLARAHAMNALDTRMREELVQVLEACCADPRVRVLVLDAVGAAFCAGTDLYEITPSSAHIARVRGLNSRLLRTLRGGRVPAIALLRGPAAGIGLSIALACDLRFATPRARLLTAFGKLGLTADGGLTWLLSRTAGLARAMEMLYTEEPVSAEQAERWGLVNAVLEDDRIEQHVSGLAHRLASRSPDALAAMKASMNDTLRMSFAEALDHEFDQQARLMDGQAFQERFASVLGEIQARRATGPTGDSS
jgi:enoyl-CoA hydratase/carnithine racemase